MHAFIVRPFGIKNEVDFDKVDKELIQPALAKAGIRGSTTAAIIEQGNIREDMFAQLLLADIVVADLSIHNANVFYELGIRHALRDKRTFLIRCSKDEIPFDLKTDRYLSYPANDPATAIDALTLALRATLLSDKADSPVFYMLPKLEAQNPERFLAVPPDFTEEVEVARVCKQYGKLSLLAEEVKGFQWEIPAYRIIGEVQFCCKDYEDAKATWEKVRNKYADDFDANDRLATIYQRMAEEIITTEPDAGLELLTQSDLAIKRLLSKYTDIERNKRAEIFSLKGRNSKTKWIHSWKNAKEEDRCINALLSPYLYEAYKDYDRGYNEDLNHFYSGINALGLLTVIIALAENLPDTWELEYDTDEEAALALKAYKAKHARLATVVHVAIDAENKRLLRQDSSDPWLNITEADLKCLTLSKPGRVKNLYSKVLKFANGFNFDAAQRQLQIYDQLNVITDNVKAALAAFANTDLSTTEKKRHYILFTGHMIDKPHRKEPRFPADKEGVVRAAIKAAVQKEKENADGPVSGICGGACGGDILFHEVCKELGIPTELYLALPREEFIVESVQFAGADWVDRFDDLYKVLPRKILSQTKELPVWLQKKGNYSIWERNNLWMLYSTLSHGAMQMTLIALWDGKEGDGEGGTEHMVSEAKERGAKTIVLKAKEII